MKKNDLKKLLKPIIKECIKEAIFEEGVLSNIISEVVKGVGTPQPIVETKTQTKEPSNSFNKLKENRPNEIRQHLQESRQKLEESTGLKGVFEGVTPMRGDASPTSQHGALNGRDPADAGVDISGIVNVAGNAWKQLK